MKTATAANAKSHLSALLAEVGAGHSVIITRRGKSVARLISEPESGGFDWSDLHDRVPAPPTSGLTVAEMRKQDLL